MSDINIINVVKKLLVNLFSIVFTVFLLSIANLSAITAQTKTCDLQFEVFQFPKAGDKEEIKINDVKAALIRLDNLKKEDAKNSNNTLRFSSLEEFPSGQSQATYRLAVKRNGYKTTFKSFRLDCSKANEKNLVSKTVYLIEGNSKERTHFIDEGDLKPIAEIGHVGVDDLILKYSQPSMYPPAAKAVHASGVVLVVVGINEEGNVAFAQAVQGNPLLRAEAVEAAKKSKFVPTLIGNKPTKVKAIMAYNFVAI